MAAYEQQNAGLAFADTEESLERMERYRAFLALQNEADDLTDEEYLSRLDELTWDDPELLDGADNYGTDLLDGEYGTPGWVNPAPADDYGDEYDNVPENSDLGAPVDDGWAYAGPEADEYGNPPIAMLRREDTLTAPETAQDGVSGPDGTGVQDDEYGRPEGSEAASDGVGAALYAAAGIEAVRDEYGSPEGQDELENEDEPDAPSVGSRVPYMGPEPQAGVPVIDLEDDEETPEMGMDGPNPGDRALSDVPDDPGPQFTDPMYVKHESFEAHDFLDEMSLATGLAGYVETYEYIPSQEIQRPQPGQPPQPSPAMAKLQRQIEAMDGPSAQREITGPDGP